MFCNYEEFEYEFEKALIRGSIDYWIEVIDMVSKDVKVGEGFSVIATMALDSPDEYGCEFSFEKQMVDNEETLLFLNAIYRKIS
ncbi:hypothetical protein HCJ58_04975 [Listeria sp. FSL L7-1509]|uniref:Uncharacterized protein n=1 Tax=Listeria immobilis TaxID=2713502 RepID=A0ABR6SV40_9LIST|nr:hypothetical protein [Listeria immobilis]MBC1506328.1 hypothetical protein [Listeria immobilis]MBC1509391.1 hypothetical protein [Listeria immobilis]MBC6304523.1 hypothetical protein [Listeria immobilis]MBC6312074.1 hypothetical protein [Listeria immobilis]